MNPKPICAGVHTLKQLDYSHARPHLGAVLEGSNKKTREKKREQPERKIMKHQRALQHQQQLASARVQTLEPRQVIDHQMMMREDGKKATKTTKKRSDSVSAVLLLLSREKLCVPVLPTITRTQLDLD